ncbi:sugar phosphate isomerase/epimerase [candidate division KSB1 bacterium]|nr:sugar phosphate isomerase/epimerase [candidate division KSB1 bacterium]
MMKNIDRRDFLKKAGTVLSSVTVAGMVPGCSKKENSAQLQWTGFHYAMCNESMKDLSWQEQCAIVANAGYTGIEIAPFTLVSESVAELSADKRKSMLVTMENSGLQCAGLHWLLAPPPKGLHFTTPDSAIREKSVDYLNKLIDFCGDLGGEVMIFGSPNQRNAVGISIDDAKKYFAEGLAAVADHALQRNVKILIETLDTSQTDVINTLAETKQIVDQINHPAVQLMFDFHNTPNETEPFDVLINRYFENIYHIHVQELDGKHLGTGDADTQFVKAFQLLKDKSYDKWISLEVFDFTPGGKVIAEESFKVLKEIENKLT